MTSQIKILFILWLLLIICSCSDDESKVLNLPEAIEMSLTDINNSSANAWFKFEYNSYEPDAMIIDQIKIKYNQSNMKFVVYLNTVCGCATTQLAAPQMIKVLDRAGIASTNYTIYGIDDITDPHPLSSIINLQKIPSAFTMINNIATYSLIDTLNHYQYDINPDGNWKIEEFILNSLN